MCAIKVLFFRRVLQLFRHDRPGLKQVVFPLSQLLDLTFGVTIVAGSCDLDIVDSDERVCRDPRSSPCKSCTMLTTNFRWQYWRLPKLSSRTSTRRGRGRERQLRLCRSRRWGGTGQALGGSNHGALRDQFLQRTLLNRCSAVSQSQSQSNGPPSSHSEWLPLSDVPDCMVNATCMFAAVPSPLRRLPAR